MEIEEAKIIIFCKKPRMPIEVSAKFGKSLSWLYGYMQIMAVKGYLIRIKRGRRIFYSANDEAYTEAVKTLAEFEKEINLLRRLK